MDHFFQKSSLLLFITLILAVSCKKKEGVSNGSEVVNAYIYAYTSGVISKADPIRVRFAEPVIEATSIGELVEEKILKFSPSIAGSASWEDEHTLFFQPDEWLNSGQEYQVSVAIDQLVDDVPKKDKSFQFAFRTKDQFINVYFNGFRAPNPTNLKDQELSGHIYVGDVVNDEELNAILTAEQDGRTLPLRWFKTNEPLKHNFVVEDIERRATASEVDIKWDGKILGLSGTGTKTMEIPALNDFKIVKVNVNQVGEQYVSLQFSDPLLSTQQVDGLIAIADYNGNYRYIIDGNELRVFPSNRITGERKITVNSGIKNVNSYRMEDPSEWFVTFESVKPKVRLVGNGVILPNSNGLIFPFEAIGLNAVEIEIFKIYDNNILQFLQSNELDGNYQLKRVGRVIRQEKVDLSALNPGSSSYQWTRYALNLDQLVQQDNEAIYQIRIGFRPSYASYFCENESSNLTRNTETALTADGEIKSIMDDWYGINGYYDGYNWSQREDPCFPEYYNPDRFVRRNVIASNLGILAKSGDGRNYFVVVTDLRDVSSISGATVEFYDFQQQSLGSVQTGGDGTAQITLEKQPYFAIASQGNQKGYLKVGDGNSLSLSRFDVAGVEVQEGMKGFLYGDRGVWRPGDSVYLNFILEDQSGSLPENYPITFELRDARGQMQIQKSVINHVERVYPLHFETSTEDPTGDWIAEVKAGGARFTKVLKIETVKPNRLKIDLDFGKDALSVEDEPAQGKIQVNWLHGAPARNLNTVVEANFKSVNTTFDKFPSFEFDDPARPFNDEPRPIFDGQVDQNGAASFQTRLVNTKQVPGKLMATFKSRAFESGGNESTDNFSIPYHPFSTYTGVEIPKNKYGSKRINLNESSTLSFAATDKDGKAVSGRNLSVGLYRVEWRWWWDRDRDNTTRYNSTNHYNAQESATISTNSQGLAQWNVTVNNWGRYLVRVCDNESGHCSGDFFYAGYPWYGDDGNYREAAAMLAFSSDKSKYEVGEEVTLTIPTGKVGRAIVTLENGSEVLDHFWVESVEGENQLKFKATASMAPTVYAHVELMQPHAQVENDLPIRLYGVIPVNVEDPDTRLQPTVDMPDELRPVEPFTVEVKESDGKPMTYSLAIVDEGLLGLTRFKTPNPWNAFYAREALGVKTWDVFDKVLGAYGGELERVLSIGGDGEIISEAAKNDVNRFKPVVQYLGPFFLPKGKKRKHTIKLPNYIGAVRTMVVASDTEKGAYGSFEKTTPVKKPLMLLATLPRVLGPGESVALPVNVFAMDEKIKNVQVKLTEASGLAQFEGPSSQSIRFNGTGDQLVTFNVKMADQIGAAKFKIEASGNGEKASQEIEILVRNPNPYVTNVEASIVQPGQNWNVGVNAIGMPGTNQGILELSNIPPINLGRQLNYLIRYPYGCIEQTLSSGFPQLYVNRLLELNETQKAEVPKNITATINRLRLFQTGKGGFSYWPGDYGADEWASSYAGHFLMEAKALGYTVPQGMLNKWIKYQQSVAKKWNPEYREYSYYSRQSSELSQAYRLYTLAIANEPDLASMNRMREVKTLSSRGRWRLAAAYAVAGRIEVARTLVNGISTAVEPYQEMSYTFGSDVRDRAMILETLLLLENDAAAGELVQFISDQLSGNRWHNTQTIAYSLLAIGKYVGPAGASQQFKFTYQLAGGQKVNAGSNTPIFQIDVPVDANNGKQINIQNTHSGPLFARLTMSGQPTTGQETAANKDLGLNVVYKTMNGQIINPTTIEQGTDFIAEVTVSHPGTRGIPYREMALDQIFPSGWEVINSRLDGFSYFQNSTKPEYQDFRDDRVYTFFDIFEKKTHTYRIQLNAAYQGRFYLPAVACEAMYDNSIYARTPGQWVEVVVPGSI